MRAVLISTYDLGRQPFGLASPAAWLRRAGVEVECLDLDRVPFDPARVAGADLVAFYLPMHTATRLALALMPRVRALAPQAHVATYGLYAAMNAPFLQAAGAATVLGGEFEAELVALAQRLRQGDATGTVSTSLARLPFLVPDRTGLPSLERYARLEHAGGTRIAGYTEASRGCKHVCRHCPVVPVYGGAFRVLAAEVVLADIRQQVEAGAEHISFGDPDFFNGPTHAMRIVRELHREFPQLSFDVTIKIEHLLRHADLLLELASSGCRLITSAVESFDDRVLEKLAKGHSRADIYRALELCAAAGLTLTPTFVGFTPWTSAASYYDLCQQLVGTGLAEQVAAIQLGVRLLVPTGSFLLDLEDASIWLGEFDPAGLSYAWRHPDPQMDDLAAQVMDILCDDVKDTTIINDAYNACELNVNGAAGTSFSKIYRLAAEAAGRPQPTWKPGTTTAGRPRMSEAWFCCAEPTAEQMTRLMG